MDTTHIAVDHPKIPDAVAFARHLMTSPPNLRNDINLAAQQLDGKPEDACRLLQNLLDMAVHADRMTSNALGENRDLERLIDLINAADATGLLQDDDNLEFIDAALAVAAERNDLLVDVWLLGDVEAPDRLLRAFACILLIRLTILAEAMQCSGAVALADMFTEGGYA